MPYSKIYLASPDGKAYRKKFNKKMAKKGGRRFTKKLKQRGGNVKSVLHELKDGTCTPHLWTRDGKLRKLKRI